MNSSKLKTSAVLLRGGFLFIKDGGVYGKCQRQNNCNDKNIDERLQEILAKHVRINKSTSKTSNPLIDWESLSKSIGDGGAAKVILDLLAKYGGRGLAYRTDWVAAGVGTLSWIKGKSEQIEADRVKRLNDATSQAKQMIEDFFKDASPEQLQTALERLGKMSKGIKAEIAERRKMWEQEMAQLSKQHDHVQMYMSADSLKPSTFGTYDQDLVDRLAILNAMKDGLVNLQKLQEKAIKPEEIKLEGSNKGALSNTQSNTAVSSKPSPTPKVILPTTNINRAQQLQPDQDKLAMALEHQRRHWEKQEQERKIYETQSNLMWQNSRGLLSDTDTLAELQKIFNNQQAALLANGIDPTEPANWTPAMRFNYDQRMQLKNKGLNSTQASLVWQNSRGMLSNTDTLAGLQEIFNRWKEELTAKGLDALDPANWTPEMRSNYDQQIQMITKELNPALESLREQYEKNDLAVEDYQTKLAELKETYIGYPEMLQLITAEETKLAEAQRLAAESKSNTMAIIEQAYNDIQRQLDDLAGDTMVQLGDSFAAAIVKGESLGDSLKKLGDDILYLVTKAMMLKMLNGIFGSLFGGGGIAGLSPAYQASYAMAGTDVGKMISQYGPWGYAAQATLGSYDLFARGGIVHNPTPFKFARGIGLMGEAGPEAIMPLARDSRSNLGVRIAEDATRGGDTFVSNFNVEVIVENSGGGDMTDEQARALGTQINAAVEMQVAKQMYDYARSGIFRSGAGRGY